MSARDNLIVTTVAILTDLLSVVASIIAPRPPRHPQIAPFGPTENRQKRVPAQSVVSVDFLSVLSPLFGVSLSAQVVPEHLKMFPRSPTHPQIRPLGPTENRQKRDPAQSAVSVDFLSVLGPLFGVSLSAQDVPKHLKIYI